MSHCLFDNLNFEFVVLRGACDRSVFRVTNTDACGDRSMLYFVFRAYLQACPILFRPMMYVYDVTHVKLEYSHEFCSKHDILKTYPG